MASRLDIGFFKYAKKVNRVIEITDREAYIPAVRDNPERRVPLPNKRAKTFQERETELEVRYEKMEELDASIEVERQTLLALVKSYRETGSGVAAVVVQNQKVATLMESRRALAHPQVWIESIKGATLMDVFESNRDKRKVPGKYIYQVKRRVEPISSLYEYVQQEAPVPQAPIMPSILETIVGAPTAGAPTAGAPTGAPTTGVPKAEASAASAQRGAIVQQAKKAFTLAKKPTQ